MGLQVEPKVREIGAHRDVAGGQIRFEVDHPIARYWIGYSSDLYGTMFLALIVLHMGIRFIRNNDFSGRCFVLSWEARFTAPPIMV